MITYKIDNCLSLTFDNVNDYLNKFESWMKTQTASSCTIDLSLIEYIDSAGVAMLVELRKGAQNRYNKSIIIKVSPVVKKMLKFYEVENLLEVYNEC